MTQFCDLRRKGKWWVCPDCGLAYQGPRAKVNCRRFMRRPRSVRQRFLAEIAAWVREGLIDREVDEIERNLDHCLADCRHFDGRVCTLRGSSCRRWQLWKETLALGECRRWEFEGRRETENGQPRV